VFSIAATLSVTAAGPVLWPGLPNRPLVHRAAAGDQVDHHADQRDEQDEQESQGLGPAGQVRAAEDVDEHRDQTLLAYSAARRGASGAAARL